jgi:hypothetical protein
LDGAPNNGVPFKLVVECQIIINKAVGKRNGSNLYGLLPK